MLSELLDQIIKAYRLVLPFESCSV